VAALSRPRLLSCVSSYNWIASFAGPRQGVMSRTTTVHSYEPRRMVNRSSMRNSRAGFVRAPLRCTFPPIMAFAARDRVLKNRAVHNHLSSRILSSSSAINHFTYIRFGIIAEPLAMGEASTAAGQAGWDLEVEVYYPLSGTNTRLRKKWLSWNFSICYIGVTIIILINVLG